ncbi:type VI secretion system-associated FHA domain protein TagH [Pseudomonas sp. HN11]|uniref:type VI secretion system-associated FHA domain protein TagH n=1 Tax=Pseudomonas sp. HN11 TaxID=1344094 RepID=UPI001F463411|nr:type VI secretion system-associated FHA domain protein TagH [Pseudomonas sp. HN11]UII74017.1 type VI secretion system-associated FHA domain protein TagH [Pseudomonas sp. HN11]
MQLVFEVCSSTGGVPSARKTFEEVGGVIGRGAGCDWIIPDADRLISSHHGLVSYRDGHYLLTDISSNGISVSGSMERLCKGQARLISDGEVYQLGTLEIRARLIANTRQSFARDDTIPDDAFLGLDPVDALDHAQLRDHSSADLDALGMSREAAVQSLCHGAVDRDHLLVPTFAEPEREELPQAPITAAPAVAEAFWQQFAQTLGMQVDTLDRQAREALAIRVASLLRQTVEGLQQSLRTRDELIGEISGALTASGLNSRNPLNDGTDTQAALATLLGGDEPGRLSAEQAVAQVCRDLQVHQLALVVACRATVRGALAAFAPGHLLLRFECEGKPPRFFTDGAHWRAYKRHYRRVTDELPQGEHLLRTEFANAYEEQVRLVSSLHAGYSG